METDTLKYLTDTSTEHSEFGPHVEKAIISMALDHPELFLSMARFMTPDLFEAPAAKYIMAIILNNLEKHEIVPSRNLLHDFVLQHLTEDDPYESVLELVDRKSDPREVPIVKEQMISWAKKRAYGLIYSDEAMLAYRNNDFDAIEKIVEQAQRITDLQVQGIWLMDSYEMLFNPAAISHRTTGFPRLDKILNSGGPGPGEVVCWVAGTNVGKSIVLCNNVITSWMGAGDGGRIGQDVLLVTFELSYIKTALRCLGVIGENIKIDNLMDHRDLITNKINALKMTYNGKVMISELPPESCSVDHLQTLLDNLRRTNGWSPDVLILDYLDLMVSRNKHHNNNDYDRQKHVANELRALAKKENVLVFTATQTNRGAADKEEIGLDDVAESYAKQFSMDYIVGINQTQMERTAVPPRLRFTISKNRNGPKGDVITCEINYDTMKVKEVNT